jgi:hypothetical protein
MAHKKAANRAIKKAGTKTAPVYALSQSMLSELPSAERPKASAELWTKSNGHCALCALPLDLSQKDSIVADHYSPEADGGKTELKNLYLAHRICNASRRDLPFEVARPLTQFRAKAEHKKVVSFDFVIDQFMEGEKRLPIKYSVDSGIATIAFGFEEVQVPISVDPATQVRYFFLEVPIAYIFNDKDIQPRAIMHAHVRKLALDFLVRPVHEPSNCRLMLDTGTDVGRLLQFDGQHKTTAQILLGRKTVPMKVYVSPEIDMLQRLVIKIQQEIKKQPLTRSETLAKIGDVMKRMIDGYVEKPGKVRSEVGLIGSQPRAEQKVAKTLYFDELKRLLFFDEDNELRKAVNPSAQNAPTTDKVVINKILGPLLWPHLLEEDLDSSTVRDEERTNILLVTNTIAKQMLPPGWDSPGNQLQRLRAENFFYQGSIGWWMNELLELGLRYALIKIGKKPLLLHQLKETDKENIQSLVETMCGWGIWSTQDSDQLAAMRSNTVKNVVTAFPEYDAQRLIKDSEISS